MMKLAYDFHIHSCLSPCGGDEATPSNIAGLAALLELDAAALTDHNTCKNCPAFFATAKETGFIPIAGMELTTEEEIHVVCLFPTLEDAMAFDEYVYPRLLPIKNDTSIFGNQIIMDKNDNKIGTLEYCLINATSIGIYSLPAVVKKYNGIIIPAHIERAAFSLISLLGFVPDDCGFDCVEIRSKEAVENLSKIHPYINQCKVIHNSDAHQLENISLPVNFIEVQEKNAVGILKALSASYNDKYL